MPLDPLLKTFLDQMAAQPTPPIHEMEPDMARAAMAALMALVGPKDVPIGKIENITMPGEAGEILGLPGSTVRVLTTRARATLRQRPWEGG